MLVSMVRVLIFVNEEPKELPTHSRSPDLSVPMRRGPCDHGTTFFGEKGWVSVDRGSMIASNPEWLRLKWGDKDVRLYESRNQWANFVACVKSRQPTVNPIDTAVNGDLISHLSDIAVRTGRTITWDPAKERIVGDAAAEAYLNRVPRLPWKVERA